MASRGCWPPRPLCGVTSRNGAVPFTYGLSVSEPSPNTLTGMQPARAPRAADDLPVAGSTTASTAFKIFVLLAVVRPERQVVDRCGRIARSRPRSSRRNAPSLRRPPHRPLSLRSSLILPVSLLTRPMVMVCRLSAIIRSRTLCGRNALSRRIQIAAVARFLRGTADVRDAPRQLGEQLHMFADVILRRGQRVEVLDIGVPSSASKFSFWCAPSPPIIVLPNTWPKS